jgi:hypothetical protein
LAIGGFGSGFDVYGGYSCKPITAADPVDVGQAMAG